MRHLLRLPHQHRFDLRPQCHRIARRSRLAKFLLHHHRVPHLAALIRRRLARAPLVVGETRARGQHRLSHLHDAHPVLRVLARRDAGGAELDELGRRDVFRRHHLESGLLFHLGEAFVYRARAGGEEGFVVQPCIWEGCDLDIVS